MAYLKLNYAYLLTLFCYKTYKKSHSLTSPSPCHKNEVLALVLPLIEL